MTLRMRHGFVPFLVLLAGCGQLDFSERPEPMALPASFTDAHCRAVTQVRVADTALNGWNAATHARVASDTYASCIATKPY